MTSQTEILERIISRIPYPEQIKDIDLVESGAVQFAWRGTQFRVTNNGADEIGDGVLIGSDIAILLWKVLKHG